MNRLQNNNMFSGYLFAIGATALWSGNFIIACSLNENSPEKEQTTLFCSNKGN